MDYACYFAGADRNRTAFVLGAVDLLAQQSRCSQAPQRPLRGLARSGTEPDRADFATGLDSSHSITGLTVLANSLEAVPVFSEP